MTSLQAWAVEHVVLPPVHAPASDSQVHSGQIELETFLDHANMLKFREAACNNPKNDKRGGSSR